MWSSKVSPCNADGCKLTRSSLADANPPPLPLMRVSNVTALVRAWLAREEPRFQTCHLGFAAVAGNARNPAPQLAMTRHLPRDNKQQEPIKPTGVYIFMNGLFPSPATTGILACPEAKNTPMRVLMNGSISDPSGNREQQAAAQAGGDPPAAPARCWCWPPRWTAGQ